MSSPPVSENHPIGLHIQLLGGFTVQVNGTTIPSGQWKSRRARNLVKLLALAPDHRLRRDQVIDILWPDSNPSAATNNLHQTLYVARRILESLVPGCLTLEEGLLSLSGGQDKILSVDVEQFETVATQAINIQDLETYQTALALYTGELLPEDRYEEWTVHRREVLQQTYLQILLGLARLQETNHDYPAGIETLQRLLAVDPCHEEAHAGLMRLYALSGQRQQAMRQFQILTQVLQAELSVEPSQETRQLFETIQSGSFGVAESVPLPGIPARRHNLPLQLTSFIGRENEIDEVKRMVRDHRLVTLTGAGGTGKTRLGLQTVTKLVDQFADGVWLVELAPLTSPDQVASTIAHVLDVSNPSSRPIQKELILSLRSQKVLLVLDNCEHLVEACARLAQALLKSCSQVHILATSREALGVPGECLFRVPSLAAPDPRNLPGMDQLPSYDAIRLFIERAASALADFHLTQENAPHVAQICWRLDGIPLAIELAAAWVKVLWVEQIATRLDDAFHLLAGGARTELPRHRTLQASVDWSYNLLSEAEQTLLRQLSVFTGGWRLEAAEAVCAAGVELLDLLSRLVAQSLVQAIHFQGQETRYYMLEIIRQYGYQKLLACGEETELHSIHMGYYAALAEQAGPELRGPRQVEWQDRMEEEIDNLHQALEWAAAHDVVAGLSMAADLLYFWHIRGRELEGTVWLERLLALEADQRGEKALSPTQKLSRGNAINALQHLYSQRERVAPHKEDMLSEALELFRELGEQGYSGGAFSMSLLGNMEEALELARRAGDRFIESQVLVSRAAFSESVGALAEVKSFAEQALTSSRLIGDLDGIGCALWWLGRVNYYQKDPQTARHFFEESRYFFQQVRNNRWAKRQIYWIGASLWVEGRLQEAQSFFEQLADFKNLRRETEPEYIDLYNGYRELANLAINQGDLDRAEQILKNLIKRSLLQGDSLQLSLSYLSLAGLEMERSHPDVARKHLQKAMTQEAQIPIWAYSKTQLLVELSWLELKERHKGIVHAQVSRALELSKSNSHYDAKHFSQYPILHIISALALTDGQPKLAARLLGAAQVVKPVYYDQMSFPYERRRLDELQARLRTVLGEVAFTVAFNEGQDLTEEQAVQLAEEAANGSMT